MRREALADEAVGVAAGGVIPGGVGADVGERKMIEAVWLTVGPMATYAGIVGGVV